MLHVGHFSFDELDYKHKSRHGYFTCVVAATDEEEATRKFKAHLIDMKQKNVAFSTIVKVYVEDIIQMKALPGEPIVTRLQSSRGEFPESVSYSLPSTAIDGIEAYGLATDVKQHENDPNGDYLESEPFIVF